MVPVRRRNERYAFERRWQAVLKRDVGDAFGR